MNEAHDGSRQSGATERSEGGSDKRRRQRPKFLEAQIAVRFNKGTLAALEEVAALNERTVAAEIRTAVNKHLAGAVVVGENQESQTA